MNKMHQRGEDSPNWKGGYIPNYFCIDCGKPVTRTRVQRCHACYTKHRLKHRQFVCEVCGVKVAQRYVKPLFCARCSRADRKARGFKFGGGFRKGMTRDKCANWKGGVIKSGGYIKIYQPEHPRATGNYVLQHLLVWEAANNKPLPTGYVIHHLNGIKKDNRIENLAALPNKKHMHILAAKAKRIQQLEGLLNGQHQLC